MPSHINSSPCQIWRPGWNHRLPPIPRLPKHHLLNGNFGMKTASPCQKYCFEEQNINGQQKLHSTQNPCRQPLPSFCASGCRVIVSLYMTQFRCLCTLEAFSLPTGGLRGRRRTTATFPRAMFKHGKKEPLLLLTFSLLNSHDFGIYDRPLPISADATASTSPGASAAVGKANRLGIGTAQSRFLAKQTQKPFA